ncbi:MAG: sensor histidine kinase [Phycisphaerales bacterium]
MSGDPAHAADLTSPDERSGRLRALLGSMRIRKKMIILHTAFSLALAVVLLAALRPSISDVVASAEHQSCLVAIDMLTLDPTLATTAAPEGVELRAGTADEVGLTDREARLAREAAGAAIFLYGSGDKPQEAVRYDPSRDLFLYASTNALDSRRAVTRMYLFLAAALLGFYLLIAMSLELVVLPKQVYGPIRALLRADLAVQEGRREQELIDTGEIPSDELGEIMRSRNESIVRLRRHETALNDALKQLETVALELKRKNHLLETARRNLADQDRLASLGMMSAGIAHELNTPLAVLKGQVERLADEPGRGVADNQAQLMLRVVKRLERLSESLLDFARVRPPTRERAALSAIVDDAWTLVRIDREARGVRLISRVPSGLTVLADPDRLGQVLVNLLRNAADAMDGHGAITVLADAFERDNRRWVSIRVRDEGPGIAPEVLSRLFEPFVSTRLDARGTGLGLAVSEGIVREHGGVMLAHNLTAEEASATGAEFEIVLPDDEDGHPVAGSPVDASTEPDDDGPVLSVPPDRSRPEHP